MSRMSTQPVIKCKRCGRPVIVASLETFFPDEDTTALREMMSNINKIVMCEQCLGEYNVKATQNRADDWAAGRP